jgi:hypothetical protein
VFLVKGFYILISVPDSGCAPSLFYEVKSAQGMDVVVKGKQQTIPEWTCLFASDCKNILFALNACGRFEICTSSLLNLVFLYGSIEVFISLNELFTRSREIDSENGRTL